MYYVEINPIDFSGKGSTFCDPCGNLLKALVPAVIRLFIATIFVFLSKSAVHFSPCVYRTRTAILNLKCWESFKTAADLLL